jgi:hypothetical protein
MTKKQLKALESLPEVIDALTAIFGQAEKLRLVMAKASGLGVLPQTLPVPAPAKTEPAPTSVGPVMLPTPERAEYEAMRRSGQQNYDPEKEETPDKKRQRELLANFRKSPTRQAKLSQFAHDEKEEVAS